MLEPSVGFYCCFVGVTFRHRSKRVANFKPVISEFLLISVRDDARDFDLKNMDNEPEGEQLDIFVFHENLVASANEELLQKNGKWRSISIQNGIICDYVQYS